MTKKSKIYIKLNKILIIICENRVEDPRTGKLSQGCVVIEGVRYEIATSR